MRVIVTGAAGFIGFHLSKRLLDLGHEVQGIDNFNDYYPVQVKHDRIKQIESRPGFALKVADMTDSAAMAEVFTSFKPTHVVNLAAQAGVRYSLINPHAYIQSNLTGFFNMLHNSKVHGVEHFVYASSSSVYGLNTNMPFSVHHNVDHPVSLYAATKKSNELIAHSYSHMWKLPTTGLRFFTVYGPWGRPDMALYIFTKAILEGKPIQVFNFGKMRRDFTYIDDIVEGVIRVTQHTATPNESWQSDTPDPGTSPAPYRIYNIGNNNTVELGRFIELIEQELGREAIKDYLPIQPGDVPATYANVDDLASDVGFKPATPIEVGIKRFVEWYREYHKA